MNRPLPQIIQDSLPYFIPEDATEESVYDLLITDQIPSSLAMQLVLFIPIAFGRAFLRKYAVRFPQTYTLHCTDGTIIDDLSLDDEPIHLTALLAAEDIIASGNWAENFHFEIAAWSSEVDAFSQALVEGYHPSKISFKELHINGDIGPRSVANGQSDTQSK